VAIWCDEESDHTIKCIRSRPVSRLFGAPAPEKYYKKEAVSLLLQPPSPVSVFPSRTGSVSSHTAEVTASSLFEAVAQGLSALRKNEWVEGIEERFGFVKVSVADVRVEHQVKIADFMKWLERPGRTPREITHRLRIRAILGMSVTR
jgi:hypothetical protein